MSAARKHGGWPIATPDVFADELERALEVVSRLPGAGSPYVPSTTPGVRRVYLRRTSLHVYYTFDEREILIRAVWGARLEHGPDINPDQA